MPLAEGVKTAWPFRANPGPRQAGGREARSKQPAAGKWQPAAGNEGRDSRWVSPRGRERLECPKRNDAFLFLGGTSSAGGGQLVGEGKGKEKEESGQIEYRAGSQSRESMSAELARATA